MDIAKWEVSLTPSQPLRLRGLGGEALFALVLTLIKRIDERLARELHDARGLKPLSVSPIDADVEPKSGITTVPKEVPCWFSFSTLSEELTESVFQNIGELQKKLTRPTLAGSPIKVTSIGPSSVEHPAPGTSYRSLLESATRPRTISLRFLSPTSFRRDKEQIVLPLPELVFRSLISRWNRFSPTPLPEGTAEAIQNVRLARYTSLSTSMVEFSTYRVIGFTGEVDFALLRGTPDNFARTLDSLTQFAYYAGIGYKTTMGMGMVERL